MPHVVAVVCAVALACLIAARSTTSDPIVGRRVRGLVDESPSSGSHDGRRRPTARRARRWIVRITLACVAVLVAFVIGPLPVAIGAVAVVGTRVARRRRRVRNVRRATDRALPAAVELFVLAVQSGLTPRDGCALLAERGPHATAAGFAAVVQRVERGATFAGSIAVLPATLGPLAVPLAAALAAADHDGQPLGPVLEQLARDARAARRRLDEADARRLAVRLTVPLVTCSLPSFILLAVVPAVLTALSSLPASLP
jgi:tight adherence protein C